MDIVEARMFNLGNSVFVEVQLLEDLVKIKYKDSFVFCAGVDKINNLISDFLNLTIRDFFEFVIGRLVNQCYSIEKTDKEFKIILEYAIQFDDKKFKKKAELEFDFIAPKKDELTIVKEELEILKKKITPTMEKVASIINRELQDFCEEFPIENISSIASNNKCSAVFREYCGTITTLKILNYYNSFGSPFPSKWNILNPITKILIVDKVDEYLKK